MVSILASPPQEDAHAPQLPPHPPWRLTSSKATPSLTSITLPKVCIINPSS